MLMLSNYFSKFVCVTVLGMLNCQDKVSSLCFGINEGSYNLNSCVKFLE